MKKLMKKLVILVIMCTVPMSVFAFSFGADNHSFNPALLGTGSRTWLSTGGTIDTGFGNNYFALNDFFVDADAEEKVYVLDFNDLYDSIKGEGLNLNLNARTDVFSMLRIWRLGVGAYATVDAYADTTLPEDLFKFLSEGNVDETEFTLTGGLDVRSFMEAGVYAGYRAGNYQIGVKVGQYLPIAYSSNVNYNFNVIMQNEEPDEEGYIIKGDGTVSGKLFTSMDIDDIDAVADDPEALMEYFGMKIDAGVVYARRQGTPLWGASVSFPVTPAKAAYTYEISGTADFWVKAPIELLLSGLGEDDGNGSDDNDNGGNGNGDNGEEEELFEVNHEFDFELVPGAEPVDIWQPLRLGAFYRIAFLPILDFIPYGEIVVPMDDGEFDFDNTVYNGGMTVTGSFLPLSWISYSMGYRNNSWETTAALDINLRLVEVGLRLSNRAKELEDVFRVTSPQVTVHAAFGL